MEYRKIQDANSSLTISIPSKFADKLGVGKGDYMSVEHIEGDNCLILKPAGKKDEAE